MRKYIIVFIILFPCMVYAQIYGTSGTSRPSTLVVGGYPYVDLRSMATITAADAAAVAAGTGLVCASTYTISSAVTVTSPFEAKKGCIISCGTGTVIFNAFSAGEYAVFDSSCNNKITLSIPVSYTRAIWGAGLSDSKPFVTHKIYLMGDSITSHTEYANHLTTLAGSNTWETINNGIPGNMTTQMVARFTNGVITPADAEYVVILGGINDIASDVSATTIESNLQSMYTAAQNAGIKVIAVTILPFKTSTYWTAGRQTVLDAVNTWILNTATNVDYKIDAYSTLEDPGNADTLLPAYDSGDHIHPSEAGDDALATAVFNGSTFVANSSFNIPIVSYSGKAISINQNLTTVSIPSFMGISSTATMFNIDGALSITKQSGTDILNLIYDSTHYVRLGVNPDGGLNLFFVPEGGVLLFGSGVGYISFSTSTGRIEGRQFSNNANANNSYIQVTDDGTNIGRYINDNKTCLSVDQAHASSTGNILDVKSAGVTKFSISSNGTASFSVGGSSGKATCWKTATTLGYCSTVVAADGSCTCN